MIKIASGFTGPGGSTVVFNTLVNLFNEHGMDACLYGTYKWEGIDCRFEYIDKLSNTKDDILIYHYINFNPKPNAKKVILSCHETEIFRIDRIKPKYDVVHFVSEFQKEWQAVDGVVIPNPIRKFSPRTNDGSKKVAGIIGSIDKNKRVHLSIERALKDGFTDIRLYGSLTDFPYFHEMIEPLLSDKVKLCGISKDMGNTYNQLTKVYHSSKQETFNLVKFECMEAGVDYDGLEGNTTKAEYWTNERILEAWKKILN